MMNTSEKKPISPREKEDSLIAPNVAISVNDEGLLPVGALSAPIEVSFPAWPNVMEGISYQLLWDDNLIGDAKLIEKGTLPGTVLTAYIPIDALTEQPSNVLSGTIASYNGMQEGDVIRTYWNNIPGPTAVVTKDDMGLKRTMVDFARPFLERIGDIEAPVYYTVTDLAGNISMESESLSLQLQLATITPLPTPSIKEATGNTLDPGNASSGATVVIDAAANLKAGDQVIVQWQGPKGSDTKEKTLTGADAGKALEVLFAAVLVSANVGQTVSVSYVVNRTSGLVQVSDTLALQVLDADGVVMPSLIPASGATVRVSYPGMGAQDSVVVNWRGASSQDTAAQIATGSELQFKLPKALISATAGGSATVTYTVTRAGVPKVSAPLELNVRQELLFDTSPVELAGKVYLLVSYPDLLPQFPANTTVQRQASGGKAPYTYKSADMLVAQVNKEGLVSVRGKGATTITVTDALGASKSYPVSVTGVIHCLGVGSGSYSQIARNASNNGARIPSIHELVEIYSAYGNRWPMGNGNYWSSTVSSAGIGGWNWYYVKNMVSGGNFKLKSHNAALGVAVK